MKRLILLTLAMMVAAGATAPAKAAEASPDEKLGWQLAVHAYTFKEFHILISFKSCGIGA
jgi:hypothetical protein